MMLLLEWHKIMLDQIILTYFTQLDNSDQEFSPVKIKLSPRYIHTYLEKLTKYIFRSEDEPILNYLNDDGVMIEPEQYFPIIPMVLVNGARELGLDLVLLFLVIIQKILFKIYLI